MGKHWEAMPVQAGKRIHRKRSSKKGRQIAHHQVTGKYLKQRVRTARNKERAWARHLMRHPNDLQAVRVLQGKV